jgi:hypothetical protein
VVFVFTSINVLNYISRFPYVEPLLHPWDKVILVVMNGFSDVLLDLVCCYFIEELALLFIKEIGLQFSLEGSLSGFGMSEILSS